MYPENYCQKEEGGQVSRLGCTSAKVLKIGNTIEFPAERSEFSK